MIDNFTKCIQGHLTDGLIDSETADKLIAEYGEISKKQPTNPAQVLLKRKNLEQIKKQLGAQVHVAKRKEFMTRLSSAKDGPQAVNMMRDEFKRIDQESQSLNRELRNILDGTQDDFRTTSEELKEGIRAVLDGTTPANPRSGHIANQIKKMFKYSKDMADDSGMIMGDLGDRYIPQRWTKEKVLKISDDEFIKDIMPELNKDDFFKGFNEDQLRELVVFGKRQIETDGAYSMRLAMEKGEFPSLKRSKISNVELKRNASRVFHFKSADGYIKIADKYAEGEKGISEAILNYMAGISIDVSTARRLGPKSGDMVNEMTGYIKVVHPQDSAKLKLGMLNGEYQTLQGTAYTGDKNSLNYKLLNASQNWMRASHLGSAVLSAITDPAFNIITNKVNGGSISDPIKNFFKFASKDKEFRQIAKDLNYDIADFNGAIIADIKYGVGERDPKGITGALATATFKLSGLDAWTKAGRTVASMTANQNITQKLKAGIEFDALPDLLKENLTLSGITKDKWDILKTHKDSFVYLGSNESFINTNSIRTVEGISYKQASELARSLDGFVQRLQNIAMNENNLSVRAVTSGATLGGESGKSGFGGKALAGTLLQYKTFPLSVMFNHTIPAMKMAWEGLQKGDLSKVQYLAMISVGMGLFAQIPLQLKEMAKGKTPKSYFDEDGSIKWSLFAAGMAQAGGLGLMGDFFLSDSSRFGRSFGEDLMGPYVGTISDTVGLFKGKLLDGQLYADKDEDAWLKFRKSGLTFLKRNTPVISSLWYTRLMTERLIFDSIDRLNDPQFENRIRRSERKMRKENGQEYWWSQGETAPNF